MAPFFRTSTLWVVDFLYDGHPRRWYPSAPQGQDPTDEMSRRLQEWYGTRARLVAVRPATRDEEDDYLQGRVQPAPMCPTGR